VSGDPAVAAGVAAMIESAPGLVCGGVLEPAAAISGLRPVCDVIVACDAAGQTAIELAAPLIRTCGGVPVIVATAAPDIGAHRAALAVGARGVLGLPPDADELVRSVGSAAGARLEQESRGQAGRVVAICGAKGGCGVSALATSVARTGRGLLIDMAGGFDDAAQRLGCAPRRSPEPTSPGWMTLSATRCDRSCAPTLTGCSWWHGRPTRARPRWCRPSWPGHSSARAGRWRR
jgi:hypothetical protein